MSLTSPKSSIPVLSADDICQQLQDLIAQPVDITNDDNLIELGLDSLHIMRLVNQWRSLGILVTFAELIEQPTLGHWLKRLNQNTDNQNTKAQFIDLQECNQIADHDTDKPFNLTDVQYAYWIGRQDNQDLGGVGCHAYLEIDKDHQTSGQNLSGQPVNPQRLKAAWHQLIKHHSMLRACFTDAGQQYINDQANLPDLQVHDLRQMSPDKAGQHLLTIRQRLSHRKLDIEAGQVIGLELSLLADGKSRLHFDVDLLVADVQSLHILLRDLASAYNGSTSLAADPDWRFSRYLAIEAERNQEQYQQDKAYWQARLPDLPTGPQLPLACDPKSIKQPRFVRRTHLLSKQQWQKLKKVATSFQLTPAMVLASAYAEVLARWSSDTNFLLNVPLFDRQTDHPNIENTVADFTNLLLLQCDCQNNKSFLQQTQTLQKQFHTDVAHASYSAVSIQRDLVKQGLVDGVAAPVVFACNLGTPLLTEQFKISLGDLHYMISQTPQVWLDHQLYEMEDGLLLAWDAVDALFPVNLINDMFAAYVELLEWLAADKKHWQQDRLELLPDYQRQNRLAINKTDTPRTEHLLHEGLFALAHQSPDRTALISDDTSLSYGQLAERALRIARLLVEQGLQNGEPVAVTLPRGFDQVCAVFGILAAGGCYVPIGVHQPAHRQAKIHSTAGIRLVLSDADNLSVECIESVTRIDIAQAADYEPLPAPVAVSPDQAAYIIFTSGSTGEPKGVEMAHAATANTIDYLNQRYQVQANSRVLAVSALDFDLSVYDLFGMLSLGGAVVLLDESQRRDANVWLELIHQHHITLWNSVPVLLDMLLVVADNDARKLPFEQVFLSGDWIGLDLPPRLFANSLSMPQLVAMGGATEAAIWSNAFDVNAALVNGRLPEHWRSIPYGKPLANQSYRVVDAQSRDCPDWVPGELWIGGVGLANGYRGDPQQTAERFVEHDGQRWYRTGDQGRYWPDGNLEFLGRIDHQVKVRGHRIELGEIEAAMNSLAGVGRAVAVTVGEPKSLAAALVTEAENKEALDVDAIRSALHTLLPDYMVPTTLAVVDSLPLSANGKVDRKQLVGQLQQLSKLDQYEAPKDQLEQQIADIWSEVLKSERISRNDDFFMVGGDSLTATQILQLLQQRRVSPKAVPLLTLFASPSIAALAEQIREQWQAAGVTFNGEETIFEEGTL